MVELKKKGNTSVATVNGLTVVRLYSTDVVMFNKDRIILNTGGHFTATTKQRMNQASREFDLGFKVYQQMFVWTVVYRGREYKFEGNRVEVAR